MGFRYTAKSPTNQSTSQMSNKTAGSICQPSLVRHKTVAPGCELWGVVLERPTSLPLSSKKFSPHPAFERSKTMFDKIATEKGQGQRQKVPVLGPTRQQTKMYWRRKYRHHVAPAPESDEKLPEAEKINPINLTLFDSKAANTVLLDAETQIKSGYPTIATSSMVSRRRRSETYDELSFGPDVRFFSELVKPIQYRWKFQRDKDKIILPSKHGYHPRSKSPTFQRLVEATEKLQVIVEHDSGMGSFEKDDESETHSEYTPGEPVLHLESLDREVKSEPASIKQSVYSMPPVKPIGLHSQHRPVPKYKIEPDPVLILEKPKLAEEVKVIDYTADEEDEDLVETPTEVKTTTVTQPEFKVDFKKMDTHSELHLFLPLIDGNNVSNETREKPKSNRRTRKVTLPSIDTVIRSKSEDKLTSRREKRSSENRRKKKKLIPRVKSGNEDVEVRDILNDVTTLMSMKSEQMLDFHPASLCMFENCVYHPVHHKSTRIRQA